jgi:hypothetical protein
MKTAQIAITEQIDSHFGGRHNKQEELKKFRLYQKNLLISLQSTEKTLLTDYPEIIAVAFLGELQIKNNKNVKDFINTPNEQTFEIVKNNKDIQISTEALESWSWLKTHYTSQAYKILSLATFAQKHPAIKTLETS